MRFQYGLYGNIFFLIIIVLLDSLYKEFVRMERSIHRVADNLSAQELALAQPIQGANAHGEGRVVAWLGFYIYH